MNRIITDDEIRGIYECAAKGMPDAEIAKFVGVPIHMANKYSARYWELKMNEKKKGETK